MRGQVPRSQRRKFLTLLATALHAYGSSAALTEYLIEQAASCLGEETSIAVFPNLVLLSFGEVPDEDSRLALGLGPGLGPGLGFAVGSSVGVLRPGLGCVGDVLWVRHGPVHLERSHCR